MRSFWFSFRGQSTIGSSRLRRAAGSRCFEQFDLNPSQHLRQRGQRKKRRPAGRDEVGSNTDGHVRVVRTVEYDDVGHPVLIGFGHCRCELHSGGGDDQDRLSANTLGGGVYQILDR